MIKQTCDIIIEKDFFLTRFDKNFWEIELIFDVKVYEILNFEN